LEDSGVDGIIILKWTSRSGMGRHVGRPEDMRPLGRPRRRQDDNIKMDFKKCDGEAWIGLLRLRIGTRGGRL